MRSLGLVASLDHIDCGHHIALDREGLPLLSPATGEGRAEPMVSVTITDITTLIIAITGLITAMSGTISVISRIRQRRRHGHDRRRPLIVPKDQRVVESVDPAPEIEFQIEPRPMAVQRVDAGRLGIDHDFTRRRVSQKVHQKFLFVI